MDDIGGRRLSRLEIVGDSALRRGGAQVDRSVARKSSADIAAGVKALNGELVIFPPVVSEIEAAGLDFESEVAKAIVTGKPAIHEMSAGRASPAQTFDENFAIR